jgi:hypothetical protein
MRQEPDGQVGSVTVFDELGSNNGSGRRVYCPTPHPGAGGPETRCLLKSNALGRAEAAIAAYFSPGVTHLTPPTGLPTILLAWADRLSMSTMSPGQPNRMKLEESLMITITGTVGSSGKYLVTGLPVDTTANAVLKMAFENNTSGTNLALFAGTNANFKSGSGGMQLSAQAVQDSDF